MRCAHPMRFGGAAYPSQSVPPRSSRWRWPRGAWGALGRSRTATAPPPARLASVQLAVLPLRMVGDAAGGDEHLGVGIADAIITRLATSRQLSLRPTAAVLSYANESAEPAKVAQVLAVDHVLVGTIQPTPNTYRMTLQLVQAIRRGHMGAIV